MIYDIWKFYQDNVNWNSEKKNFNSNLRKRKDYTNIYTNTHTYLEGRIRSNEHFHFYKFLYIEKFLKCTSLLLELEKIIKICFRS